MLNEFYDFIAKKINSYFQATASEGALLKGESFCLKLDDEEMVVKVILSILVDTFISKISFPMQPGPEIGSISDA